MEKLFSIENLNNVNEIRDCISKSKLSKKSTSVAFRVFLNYCEENEFVPQEALNYARKRIKLNNKVEVDTYVPTKEEVEKSLEVLWKQETKQDYWMYRLIYESGCRVSELDFFLKFLDIEKVEYHDHVCVYPLFYKRGYKSSFYLFIKKETMSWFVQNKDSIEKSLSKFKKRIYRKKEVVSLKYLRKRQFNNLIEAGIDFEIANFIQGRVSSNVGFNHYLAKKEIVMKNIKLIFKES